MCDKLEGALKLLLIRKSTITCRNSARERDKIAELTRSRSCVIVYPLPFKINKACTDRFNFLRLIYNMINKCLSSISVNLFDVTVSM